MQRPKKLSPQVYRPQMLGLKCSVLKKHPQKLVLKFRASNIQPHLSCLQKKASSKKPYTIGTRDDVLSQKYIRNQFLPTESIFLPLSDVPQRQTTLRSSATFESNSTGQGFVHCQCTTRCKTKKCKCRQLFRSCNSRCHNSNSCDNKE